MLSEMAASDADGGGERGRLAAALLASLNEPPKGFTHDTKKLGGLMAKEASSFDGRDYEDATVALRKFRIGFEQLINFPGNWTRLQKIIAHVTNLFRLPKPFEHPV